MSALAERLGYAADAKLVILSCDDLGSCHAANVGVYRAIRDGLATCASIMVPAPWARHAADRYERTTTSASTSPSTPNTTHYRWGPSPTHRRCSRATEASRGTSTTSGNTPTPTRSTASSRRRSPGAQAWGIDVTHLAPHLTAITLRPEFFGIYLELAFEFAAPDPPPVVR